MIKSPLGFATTLAALASLSLATPAEARRTYNGTARDPGHGHCLRFNKTTGAVAGGVGGALLGKAIFGGPVGVVAGAAAGGLGGHALAHNGRKRCR